MLLHRISTCSAHRCSRYVRQRFALTAALHASYASRPSFSSSSSAQSLERATSTRTTLVKEVRANKNKKESTVVDISGPSSLTQSYASTTQSFQKKTWYEQYFLLADYKSREGNCLVPNQHIEGDIKLGRWVDNQRQFYKKGKLSKSRVDLLNEIGFSWDPLGEQWESNFLLLTQYKKREGNCLVPEKYSEGGVNLGIWVDNQRKVFKRGKMPQSRVDLLNEIGFSWDLLDEQWENNFSLLKQYKAREGNCMVPRNHIEGGTKLGNWVHTERNIYKSGKMPKRQVDMMNELGFSWDPFGEQWEEKFLLLKQFKEREGHCNVKSIHKEGDVHLGQWLQNQKQARKRGTLSEERFQRLQELGAPIE